MKFNKIKNPDFIPFDIETTGFRAADDDIITNVVLHHNGAYHIWINMDDASEELDQEYIEDVSNIHNFVLYKCNTEKQLLESIDNYLDNNTDETAVLTAFNGETWKGSTDFDLPFLRTRCLRNGLEWILSGYWYTDTFEVLSKKSRFDTTIKSEPALEKMKKTDVQQFIDDMDYDIDYDSKNKREIKNIMKQTDTIDTDNVVEFCNDNFNKGYSTFNQINKGEMTDYIDDKNIQIGYDKMSKEEMIKELRGDGFESDELIEWYELTGRDIGNEEATTLDGIHEVLLEDMNLDEWDEPPVVLESFEPFDPFESSGEAVTQYHEGNYEDVILHCFADVARTVNITRIMAEYVPRNDYRPKIL